MSEEYIFSFSREAMLKRCLREYYLHAFYAYGEYDVESADRKRNHVHLLKQLKSESLFVESILSDSIRKIFVDGMTINEFRRSVMNKFFFAKDDMLLGGYEYDHLQNPLLCSFYYEEKSIAEIFSTVLEQTSNWIEDLLNNDLFVTLFKQERQNFYPVDEVPFVFVGKIKVYFPLSGIIKYDGFYYCFNFVRNAEYYQTYAVLHLLYCQQRLHVSPEFVRHIFLDSENILTLYTELTELNISQVLNDIAERSAHHHYIADMLAEIEDPFAVCKADDPATCKNCRFREFCGG